MTLNNFIDTLKSFQWCNKHGLTRMVNLLKNGKTEPCCIKCVAESMFCSNSMCRKRS